jgi:Zn-dependent alcohol dehydrogenase
MPIDSQAVIQEDVGRPFEIVDITVPAPTGHQVLVEMISSGVCQSQLYWSTQQRTQPMLFGHEGYGTVAELGPDVSGLNVGDPVLITWIPRLDGSRKAVGSSADLADGRTATSPNVHTWAKHVLVDDLYVVRIPAESARAEAAVVACAVLTGAGAVLHSAKVGAGDKVVVIGLGGVGLSAVAAARQRGASQVIAVDLHQDKIDFALELGATDGVLAGASDVPSLVRELTQGADSESGADFVIDCVGLGKTVDQGLRSLRLGRVGRERGGAVVLVGVPEVPITLDAGLLLAGERSLIGSMGGSSKQEHILRYLEWERDGQLDLERMVTTRYSFEEIGEATSDLAAGKILGRSIVVMKHES